MALPEPIQVGRSIRRLRASDRAAIRACFLRLAPETRANRFMGGVGDAGIQAYAERSITSNGLIFGAFVSGILRGVEELQPTSLGATPFHLGVEAEAVRKRGVGDLHVRCLACNGPMRRYAIRHGADLRASGMKAEAVPHLDRPTAFSVWHESIAEVLDLMIAALPGRTMSDGTV